MNRLLLDYNATDFGIYGPNITKNDSLCHAVDDLYDVPIGLLILLSFFYGSISILAVIGNSLVIWIVSTTRQMQTVTNMFIANLALADVVIGMFAIPFQFQAAALQRWNLPEFMCAFCPYVQLVTVNVSVFTLTAIAVDRHRAIINPFRARPPKYVCKIVITVIWIISLVSAIPTAIALRVVQVEEFRIFHDGTNISYTKPFCDVVGLPKDYMQHYRYYLVFVQYVIPFCVISFVYIQMAIRLWGSKTPGNAQDTRDLTLMRNKKRVIKMLIIVVLLFGLCWFPLQLYNILQVTWESVNEYRYINIIWFCSDWLAMSNSCYNPFIYGIYNEKFKREFRRRFSLFRVKNEPPDVSDQTISMYTRASSMRSICTTSSTRLKTLPPIDRPNSGSGFSNCAYNTIEHNAYNSRASKKEPAVWNQSSIRVKDNPGIECQPPRIFNQNGYVSETDDHLKKDFSYQPISGKGSPQCDCHCDQHNGTLDQPMFVHETSSSLNFGCDESCYHPSGYCRNATHRRISCDDCVEL